MLIECTVSKVKRAFKIFSLLFKIKIYYIFFIYFFIYSFKKMSFLIRFTGHHKLEMNLRWNTGDKHGLLTMLTSEMLSMLSTCTSMPTGMAAPEASR